jgi:integrase
MLRHAPRWNRTNNPVIKNLKYQSDVDIDQLIRDAESELAESAPEQYKIFLLGCMAGYRCQPHFRALAAWLREHGIEGDKPIHVLRKEFGSRINENGDIHSASMALRHADIGTTAQFYADTRKRVTTDFGRLLKSAPANVVSIDQSDVPAQEAI